MSYNSAGAETEITRLDFQENTQIELCRDITLFTYLSIRFDGQPTTYEEDPEKPEEAI